MVSEPSDPEPKPWLSVVVITYARVHLLRACIASLRRQPERDVEFMLVLNGATPNVTRVAHAAAAADRRFVPLVCPSQPASGARNYAAERARAPWLLFLDDDVELPEGGLDHLRQLIAAYPQAMVFGGPNLTHKDEPPFAQMAGELLATRWGTGPTRARYAEHAAGLASERDLTLCNLAVHGRVFEQGLRFPDHYFGGEENVLMGHVQAAGGEMRYSPALWVYHRRRHTWRGHCEQMVRYGRGRAVAYLWSPITRRWIFFVPVLFAAYLLVLPWALLLAREWLWWGWITPALAYLAGTGLSAAGIAWRRRRLSWWPKLLLLFPCTHIAYAWGLASTLARPPAPQARSRPAVPG